VSHRSKSVAGQHMSMMQCREIGMFRLLRKVPIPVVSADRTVRWPTFVLLLLSDFNMLDCILYS